MKTKTTQACEAVVGPSFPGSKFTPENFVRMIKDRGLPVLWEKAMLCPNRRDDPNPGDHDPNCSLCDSSGYLYVQPVETQMVVQGASIEQVFYIQGRFDSGIASITALPQDRISYWDRVTLKKSRIRYSELIQRRESTATDRLRYQTLDVFAVQYKTRIFMPGRDFTVDGDKLVWTKNAAGRPPDRAFYSVMTERRPVYIILELTNQFNDVQSTGTTQEMPLSAQAKLDFLVRDESKEPRPPVAQPSPFARGT